MVAMSIRRNLTLVYPELKAYAIALVRGTEIAEDLAQEAVRKALSAKKTPKNIDDLRPWMFRILRNLYIDHLRREKTRREYSTDNERLYNEGTGYYPVVLEEILVRQAFVELKVTEREILYLIDVLGLKYSEAAIVLGVAEGTIMSRISRARRALLGRIEQTNVTPLQQKKE
jgi:RNA polymerase sigma-70 factor, ECF subfamily